MILALILAVACNHGQHMEAEKCVPNAALPDPTFKRSDLGWIPMCPQGTELIRQIPKPACFWGVKPMARKSSEGEYQCRPVGALPKLAACPVE